MKSAIQPIEVASCSTCSRMSRKDFSYKYCMAMAPDGTPRTPTKADWQEPLLSKSFSLRYIDGVPKECPGHVKGAPGFSQLLSYRPGEPE